jgi:hypothetical protein
MQRLGPFEKDQKPYIRETTLDLASTRTHIGARLPGSTPLKSASSMLASRSMSAL